MAKKKKRPIPLAVPEMKSRKKARKVTSLFHKLTRQLDQAKADHDIESVKKLEQEIEEMGGRQEYQRASQLSTKFHSTSKWVLKILRQRGWTAGGGKSTITTSSSDVLAEPDDNTTTTGDIPTTTSNMYKDNEDIVKVNRDDNHFNNMGKTNPMARPTYILEIGAINTELIDASKKMNGSNSLYNIKVKAIDLHASHPDIEEQDFFQLPIVHETKGTFDAIVCSMVLNCVTTPADRGTMLSLLYKQLRPGGLCFLTIPKLCINQSRYMNREMFEEILSDAIGFVLEHQKETPKVAFWVLKRPEIGTKKVVEWKTEWETTRIIRPGPKFRNCFAVSLVKDKVCPW